MKLYPFIDSSINAFIFNSESKPSAIFCCDKKVSKWGLSWKDVARSKAIIVPHLTYNSWVHAMLGLNVVELLGIDNKIFIVVVEERLPKSKHSITYGLILDPSKLNLELCESLTAKGYIFFPEDRALWTPQYIQALWDQVDEAHCDNVLALLAAVQMQKRRATK